MQEDSLTYYNPVSDTIKNEELFFDKYFSKKYSSETSFFANETVSVTSAYRQELKHEEISQRPDTFDWFFGIFLLSFIFLGRIIGRNAKDFFSMITEFFAIKGRRSIFSETTNNEWQDKVFLCFQTCLLLAVFLCKYFSDRLDSLLNFPVESLLFALFFTFMIFAFFIIKCGMYYLVGTVFFDKTALRIWMNNFFSLFAYSGILLFVPVLCYFYVEELDFIFLSMIFIYLILFEVFIIYKSILLFFYKPSSLLHLFLYLCGQEIIPLFFLWKIMDHMSNFVVKNALWL